MHAFVTEVMRAIAVPKDAGEKAVIPEAQYKAFRERVREQKRDIALLEDLVVMFARLERGGLKIAAKQLLDLAKIGLTKDALGASVERARNLVDTAPTQALAIGGGDKKTDEKAKKAAADRVKASGKDAHALAAELLGLAHDPERKAALAALRAAKPKPLAFSDVVAAAADAKTRENLVVNFGGFLLLPEKTQLLSVLALGASSEDAMAARFLLQFGAKKDLPELLKAAAAFPRESLRAVAEGVRLADGRALSDAL